MKKLLELYTIFLFGIFCKYTSSETIYNCLSNSACGCSSNPAILTKIVGGEPASSQTWGWIVSLRYTPGDSLFCGGSIISPLHILTAAHCTIGLSSPSSVRIYAGSIYSDAPTQIRDVSVIHIHPTYSPTTYVDDISILKLSSPLDFSQNDVNIVCLPDVSSTILATEEYPPVNTSLIAIGWGYTSQGSGIVSSILQQVTIQVVAANSIYCQNARIADSSKQFCAGIMPEGGKDTCQGDSGGPLLMFTSENVWQQVGITSYGSGCAEANYPGVYTRVATYQSWINETMNNANNIYSVAHRILIPVILLFFL